MVCNSRRAVSVRGLPMVVSLTSCGPPVREVLFVFVVRDHVYRSYPGRPGESSGLPVLFGGGVLGGGVGSGSQTPDPGV